VYQGQNLKHVERSKLKLYILTHFGSNIEYPFNYLRERHPVIEKDRQAGNT
jgi:hypothetical protein